MATIIKRKSKYSVVYYYLDEKGEKKQRWETWGTHKEALKRKSEIENQQNQGIFIPPSGQNVADFLHDFVGLYGEQQWSLSTYDANVGLITNYINPAIGTVAVQDITARFIDKFYKQLEKTPAVASSRKPAKNQYVSATTIQNIHKLLRCAFGMAVRWEMIGRNPFEIAMVPKAKYKKRDIWDADMIRKALDECRDSKLYLAINLSFACSLRMGEVLGLTWDNVHISEDEIASDSAYVFVDKELQRASKRAIEMLDSKDILKIFPSVYPNTSTRVVLKTPKTESSVRKIWLPKTVSYILKEWKQSQDELREFLGDEYQDNNLVVAMTNGRPCDSRVMLKEFEKLREKADLPNVVFHSLRHSSTTYKLKLNHGDLKATQGDTGHAEIDMITKVYAHILDEDRKINAQKFEAAFYSNPDLRKVEAPKAQAPELDLQQLIEQLRQSPELANTLANIIKVGNQ